MGAGVDWGVIGRSEAFGLGSGAPTIGGEEPSAFFDDADRDAFGLPPLADDPPPYWFPYATATRFPPF